MVFYKNDKQILPSHHNMPFYVTVSIHAVELKCTLIDPSSFFNIMPLLMLKEVGIR